MESKEIEIAEGKASVRVDWSDKETKIWVCDKEGTRLRVKIMGGCVVCASDSNIEVAYNKAYKAVYREKEVA